MRHKLKDFIRPVAAKLNLTATSVKLTTEQIEFIKTHNINLSRFVRAQLDDLIRYANKEDKGEAV